MSSTPDSVTQISLAADALKNGKTDAAMEILKSLLAKEPDHELATGMLAAVYAELGIHDRAEALFTRALELNQDNPLARLQLGITQMQLGKPEAALASLNPLLDDPNDFLAHFYSGLLMAELNNFADARITLTTAAQRMPADHPLRPNLRAAVDALPES